jgi:hypothetical protein
VRPVKSKPRFKCDFCRRVATEAAIARHEPLCYKNPDRFCPTCKNTGTLSEDYGSAGSAEYPCPYCKPSINEQWAALAEVPS